MMRAWLMNLGQTVCFHTSTGRFCALGILLLAALIAPAGCKRGQNAAQQSPQRPPPTVTVAEAIGRRVPVYLDEIGKMASIETVAVVPQVGGKILAAPVDEGTYVKKGALLFQIDPRPYQARLDAAQAALAQAKAGQRLAETEFKRIQQLAKTDVASQLEFDQKRSALDVAQAQVAAADADIELAKLNLDYTTISSPIDGRAGARLVDVGNVVKENGDPLVRVQQITPIYAQFTITENDLGTVRKFLVSNGVDLGANPERGMKALVDVPGDSREVLSALGGLKLGAAPTSQPATAPRYPVGPREGTLTFLDSRVDSATGTVMLRAIVPNEDHYFWPGQFVNVRLILAHKPDAVLVPLAAVQLGSQGSYVFVVDEGKEGSTAHIRPIVAGQRHGELVAVDEGLVAGEKVIVAGQMMVVPDGPVAIAPPPAPAAPAAASPSASTRPVAAAR